MLDVTQTCSTTLVHAVSEAFCCSTGDGNLHPFLQHAIDLCRVNNKLLIEMESDLSHMLCSKRFCGFTSDVQPLNILGSQASNRKTNSSVLYATYTFERS